MLHRCIFVYYSRRFVSRYELFRRILLRSDISNALEVSADDLLCDSLVRARPTYEREIAELLSDCTDEEIRILTKTMRAFKESLRGI